MPGASANDPMAQRTRVAARINKAKRNRQPGRRSLRARPREARVVNLCRHRDRRCRAVLALKPFLLGLADQHRIWLVIAQKGTLKMGPADSNSGA